MTQFAKSGHGLDSWWSMIFSENRLPLGSSPRADFSGSCSAPHNNEFAVPFNNAEPRSAHALRSAYARMTSLGIGILAMPFPQSGYSLVQAGTGTDQAAAGCRATAARRSIMSDYRDPNDPMYGNLGYEPSDRRTNSGWGWIAAALFLVIVLAIGFGVAHEPTRVASNDCRQRRRTRRRRPLQTRARCRASRRRRRLFPAGRNDAGFDEITDRPRPNRGRSKLGKRGNEMTPLLKAPPRQPRNLGVRNARPISLLPLKGGGLRRQLKPPPHRSSAGRWNNRARSS